jgi:hypothetical protein
MSKPENEAHWIGRRNKLDSFPEFFHTLIKKNTKATNRTKPKKRR